MWLFKDIVNSGGFENYEIFYDGLKKYRLELLWYIIVSLESYTEYYSNKKNLF